LKTTSIKEIALLFLKLGSIAFGGPAAHIAMLENEVVKKRKWLTPEHFLDLVGATNLIPGPNSTEMTMHIGYERAGWKGLFIAGGLFILPAVLVTMVIAWAYAEYGTLPEVEPFIYGIQPAVIAIILSAVYTLGKKALKTAELWVLGILVVVVCLWGVSEIVALFGCGLIGLLLHLGKNRPNELRDASPVVLLSMYSVKSVNISIFLTFLKVGALLYGSGYVLFAFLDAELVSTGIITKTQLMDAVAVGQFTPGPVLSTATFVGWQINGFWGALAATIGIFLPSFLFVLLLNPLIPRLRKSKAMSAFLDAVNVAAVAVIVAVALEMGTATLQDWKTITIAALAFIIAFVFKKLNSAYLVIGGSLLGYLLSLV
jgi:chromate transporter